MLGAPLAGKLYFGEVLSEKENNPKEVWKLIKSTISTNGPTTTNCFTSNVSGNIIENPIEICEHF